MTYRVSNTTNAVAESQFEQALPDKAATQRPSGGTADAEMSKIIKSVLLDQTHKHETTIYDRLGILGENKISLSIENKEIISYMSSWPESLQTTRVLQILESSHAFRYHKNQLDKAIKSLPTHLATEQLISTVLSRMEHQDIALIQKIICELPEHLQTDEIFTELYNAAIDWDMPNLSNTISKFPKHLQKENIFKVLTKCSDENRDRLCKVILKLPEHIKIDAVLKRFLGSPDYIIENFVEAILLLPEELLNQENVETLVNHQGFAFEDALELLAPRHFDAPQKFTERHELPRNHSSISNYIGTTPGPDGIGFIHQFKVKEEFISDEERRASMQIELFPAPEGPDSYRDANLRFVSSGNMQQLIELFGGQQYLNVSLFTACQLTEKQLLDDLEKLRQDGCKTEYATRRLRFFQNIFSSWVQGQLGYTYSQEDQSWTVPDIQALRYGLGKLGIPLSVGEVPVEIISDLEYLKTSLTCDVMLGLFAHDHWVHIKPQISRLLKNPEEYKAEQEKRRLATSAVLLALSEYEQTNPQEENKDLIYFFYTILSSYIDVFTTQNEESIRATTTSEIYNAQDFFSYFSKRYPTLINERNKTDFWQNKFLPFAIKLLESHVSDNSMRNQLISIFPE